MPIRTRRGRAAAYRALWEWPLYSPRRLLTCLVALVAAGLAVSLLTTLAAGTARSGVAAGPAALPVPAPAPPSAGGAVAAGPGAAPSAVELDPPTLPLTATPPAALVVARSWTAAWTTHPQGTTTEQWLAGLAPLTTDEFLGVLSTVDLTKIPGSRVTGPAQATEVRAGSVRVQVPTDGATLSVLVVDTGAGGWKVAGYDRAA